MKPESPVEAAEREWQAQELARLQQRDGLASGSDARARQYELIARALRQPLPADLPADFARRVAARAQAHRLDIALEGRLLRITLGVFGLLVLLCLYANGADWLARLQALAPGSAGASGWLWLLLACVGVNSLIGRRRLHTPLP